MLRSLLSMVLFVGVATATDPKPASLPTPAERKVSFDADVKPILTAHCFPCHGGAKEKGGLKLDNLKAALAGGNGGAVIVTGKSADSRLIHAVVGREPEAPMPPGDAKKLTAEQVGVLRAWIDQGAKWGTATSASMEAAKPTHW